MAIEDQVSNEVREMNGQTVVFCAGPCSHTEPYTVEMALPDGSTRTEERPPDGYAPVNMLESAGWVREGDQLVCGNPVCLEEVAGVDADEIRDLGATQETLTPEQVAAMSPIVANELDDVEVLQDAFSKAEAMRASQQSEENGGADEEE